MRRSYYAKNTRTPGDALERALLLVVSYVTLFSLAAATLISVTALLT